MESKKSGKSDTSKSNSTSKGSSGSKGSRISKSSTSSGWRASPQGASSKSSSSVKTELDLNFLRQCVRDLRDALKSGGEDAEEAINSCFNTISSRVQEYRQAGQPGQSADARQVNNEAIDTLKQASQMGYDNAKKLLSRIGASSSTSSQY